MSDVNANRNNIGSLSNLETTTKSSLVDAINELKSLIQQASVSYPIGSIIMSANPSFDPNTTYGGTWERIKGKFLVGVDEDDTDFATVEKTGGSKQHYHQYGVQYNAFYSNLYSSDERLIRLYNGQTGSFVTSSSNGSSSETGNNGVEEKRGSTFTSTIKQTITNTTSASTLPPYQTVYMWVKTAM